MYLRQFIELLLPLKKNIALDKLRASQTHLYWGITGNDADFENELLKLKNHILRATALLEAGEFFIHESLKDKLIEQGAVRDDFKREDKVLKKPCGDLAKGIVSKALPLKNTIITYRI